MLFHIFRHIQPHQCVRRVEQVERELLDQLGFAYAGRADEQEGRGLALGADARARAADGRTDRVDRLILADDMALEAILHALQARGLLRRDLGGRDAGPDLDDRGEQLLVDRRGGLGHQLMQAAFHLQQTLTAGGNARIGVLLFAARARLGQQIELGLQAFHLGLQGRNFGQLGRIQIEPRAGLVDQVDGLVGQEAVGDIPLAHLGRTTAHFVRNGYAVEALVVRSDALQNFGGLCDRRLADIHRLEAALERGVLFDILAVLLEGGRADHLDVAARERGFENVRRVHRAFRVARADDVMHLVDHEDDVAQALDLVDQALHAAFKLAAELRARDKRGQVEQVHLFIAHLKRDAPLVDADGETLGYGGLADARLADQAGVVLLPAV